MKRFNGFLVVMLAVLMLALCAASLRPVVASAEWVGVFEFKHFDADGRLIWTDESYNSLADEGEYMFLDVVLRNGTAPTQFYLRLSDTTTTCSIVDTDTLTTASAGEPSTNGYAANLIERSATGWPTLALDSGDYQATSSEETFTATGGSWGPVCCALVASTSDNTGKLISYAGLSQCRTLAAGETLKITYKVKLQ